MENMDIVIDGVTHVVDLEALKSAGFLKRKRDPQPIEAGCVYGVGSRRYFIIGELATLDTHKKYLLLGLTGSPFSCYFNQSMSSGEVKRHIDRYEYEYMGRIGDIDSLPLQMKP